ncbi:hypothetical protein PFISCL1PPCAC_2561, partial [Pristionchus fissidentatus]
MSLDRLPDELLQEIDSSLPFEDSLNLQIAYSRSAHLSVLSFYDSIQVCDDPNECFIIDSNGRKEKRRFMEQNLSVVARALPHLRHITIQVKDGSSQVPSTSLSEGETSLFKDISLFSSGGFLGRLISQLGESSANLESISLHVDVQIDSFQDQFLYTPSEDLFFALSSLTKLDCRVFIHISFCAMQFMESDGKAHEIIFKGMEDVRKRVTPIGASVQYDSDVVQKYADMTVEWKNIEYCFAFFYFNEAICEPINENEEEMEEEEEEEEEE